MRKGNRAGLDRRPARQTFEQYRDRKCLCAGRSSTLGDDARPASTRGWFPTGPGGDVHKMILQCLCPWWSDLRPCLLQDREKNRRRRVAQLSVVARVCARRLETVVVDPYSESVACCEPPVRCGRQRCKCETGQTASGRQRAQIQEGRRQECQGGSFALIVRTGGAPHPVNE